jgi:polysaccharide export outer membrane protein
VEAPVRRYVRHRSIGIFDKGMAIVRIQRPTCIALGMSVALAGLSACAKPDLPSGAAAYERIPAPVEQQTVRNYRIGPLDTINITVFQEPDLTLQAVQVDAAGSLLLPLIGTVQAAGKTANELAAEVASRLEKRFLENPQVSVIVASSVSQKVVVEGSVNEAGVYEIKGRTTLIEALAMAKGTNRVAALDEVVIFRDINGQRMGALFDVGKIRRGEMDDPEILGNDTVVVGFSYLKGAWRDFLTTAPLIGAFGTLSR